MLFTVSLSLIEMYGIRNNGCCFVEKIYTDPNNHIRYIIWHAASYETPPILMNEIPVEDLM